MTKKLEQVSVTEIGSFRECRRRWLYGTHLGYQTRSTAVELWFGDLMHAALQVFTEKGVKAAVKHWLKTFDLGLVDVKESYGGLWEEAQSMYAEYREMGAAMLQNYELFVEAMGVEMDTIHMEQRVWVPIREPGTVKKGEWVPGKPVGVKLTARMDRVVGIDAEHYILDYKTGSAPSGKALEIADQPTGYSYIHWRITDEVPAGVFIEGLMKKLPEEPRILKNGTLSTAKNQNTLPALYEATMKRMGLMRSAEHLQCLAALQEQGWDGYFEREMTQRNGDQILNYEKHLYYVVQDMLAVVADPEKAYPSPSQMRCPRCPLINVCMAMEDGGDYEYLLETQFEINTERRW